MSILRIKVREFGQLLVGFALADAMGGLSTYAMHNGTSSWEVLAGGQLVFS